MKTTTAITMTHTVSAAHGTGADIIILGIHGASPHGDITDGTTHGTTADTGAGTTLGTTADTGEDGTTHGITEASGEADGTTQDTTHTTDGMIHIGATITTMYQAMRLIITRMCGMVRDIRPVLKDSLPAHHPSEEA